MSWLDPQRFGVDAYGKVRTLATVGTHTAFYGKTGSGKTRAALAFVGAGLLDRAVDFAVIDGKDDAKDVRPMMSLCEVGYVQGSSSASVGAVLRLLRTLEQINNSRTDGDFGESNPIIVLVDEWYRIRQAAMRHDKAALVEIDSLMGDFAATSRSHFMHGVFCFQRGTVKYMPGDLGANIGQRVQGMVAKKAEVQYSLNSNPEVLPAAAGEFLISSDEGDTSELVSVPFFTPANLETVVGVATRLRRPVRLAPATEPVCYEIEPDDGEREPTWQELVQVILEEAGQAMSASAILRALPEDKRPTPHENRFGRDYLAPDAASEWPTVTRCATRSGAKGYRLADGVLPVSGGQLAPSARSKASTPLLLTKAAS